MYKSESMRRPRVKALFTYFSQSTILTLIGASDYFESSAYSFIDSALLASFDVPDTIDLRSATTLDPVLYISVLVGEDMSANSYDISSDFRKS